MGRTNPSSPRPGALPWYVAGLTYVVVVEGSVRLLALLAACDGAPLEALWAPGAAGECQVVPAAPLPVGMGYAEAAPLPGMPPGTFAAALAGLSLLALAAIGTILLARLPEKGRSHWTAAGIAWGSSALLGLPPVLGPVGVPRTFFTPFGSFGAADLLLLVSFPWIAAAWLLGAGTARQRVTAA